MTLRLVSYNVRYFGHALRGLASTARAKEAIAHALVSLEPLADLIALQEVETRSVRSTLAHRGDHRSETQLEAFLRHLNEGLRHRGLPPLYRPFYFPAHVYRVGALTLYTTGLAVLVNARTLHVHQDNGHAPHAITFHASPRLKTLKQTRIAAHLSLETLHGRAFHFFNTHVSLPTPWAREFFREPRKLGTGKNQLEEVRSLLAYAQKVAAATPYVVGGDFNSGPGTPVFRALVDAGLRSALDVERLEPGFSTAGFMQLRMHLDHVFGSPGITFIDTEGTCSFGDERSPFFGLSDHVPVVTRFALG